MGFHLSGLIAIFTTQNFQNKTSKTTMKHITFLLTFLLFNSMISNAQDAQWVRTIKSQGFNECFDLAVDNSGFIYITGQIEFISTFDDGFQLESAGIHDIFLAKYDSLGNRIWAKRAGSRYGGEKGHSIAIDASHNVYLCGEIDDTT